MIRLLLMKLQSQKGGPPVFKYRLRAKTLIVGQVLTCISSGGGGGDPTLGPRAGRAVMSA
jgi:hypothetical protein